MARLSLCAREPLAYKVAAGIVGASCLQLVALAMEPKGGTPESPNTGHGSFFYDTDV